jgi:predicted RNase H-like HicB family nuclease
MEVSPKKDQHMQVTAILTPAEIGGYVAFNPETGTTTQGETVEAALENLREAVELYLEEAPMTFPGPALVTTVTLREHA